MNDICSVSELLYTIIYPDDTSVIMSGNNLKSLIQSVNSELCLLNTWLKANKLSLNVNKTYYLVFHRVRLKVDNDNFIWMNDGIINSASHLKYLGVIKDSKLNWRILFSTYVKIKFLRFKARDYLNKKCLSNLYHTYIFPYLIYCIEVRGNVSHYLDFRLKLPPPSQNCADTFVECSFLYGAPYQWEQAGWTCRWLTLTCLSLKSKRCYFYIILIISIICIIILLYQYIIIIH